MTNITLETFKETHQQLKTAVNELKELQGVLATGDASALDRHALVIEQIQELKKIYIEQREALSTTLLDGRRLWAEQYKALERFASNNKLAIDRVLSKITVEGGVVTECEFRRMGLTTTSGLESLVKLRRLNVQRNSKLTSLKGIPTQAIEEINAYACGLTGDLSELSRADKLKVLNVSFNKGLTSLKGIPTQAIEKIIAEECSLIGDLSELSGAYELKMLDVDGNVGLTSLKGIPTQAIQKIDARGCGLRGDHNFLAEAQELTHLDLRKSTYLRRFLDICLWRFPTLDKTKFNSRVKLTT